MFKVLSMQWYIASQETHGKKFEKDLTMDVYLVKYVLHVLYTCYLNWITLGKTITMEKNMNTNQFP